MPIVTIIFACLILGAIIWVALLKARDKRDRRRQIWAQIAQERGGRFLPAKGFWTRKNERIEIHVGEVALVLDSYSTGGDNPTQYSRVRGTARGMRGCRFKVYREGVFSSMGKALGTQDVVIGGHSGFDDHFMVKADDPMLVRRVWTPALMKGMAHGFAKATLSCDGVELELVDPGFWNDAARMNAALDLVAELAARDIYSAKTLAQVAGASLSWTAEGPPRIELDAPSRVVIEPVIREQELHMIARLVEPTSSSALTLAVSSGRVEDAELAAQLGQGAQVHLPRVGAGTLQVEGSRASFVWQSVDVDASALRAGAELLCALASESAGGVYR